MNTLKKIIFNTFAIGIFALFCAGTIYPCDALELADFIDAHNLADVYQHDVRHRLTKSGIPDPYAPLGMQDLDPHQAHIIRSIIATLPGIPFDINTIAIKAARDPDYTGDAFSCFGINSTQSGQLELRTTRVIFIGARHIDALLSNNDNELYERLRFSIAHEIGHLVLDHIFFNIKKDYEQELIQDPAARDTFALQQAKTRRLQELQADRWAMQALNTAEGAITEFRFRLLSQNGQDLDIGQDPYLKHPPLTYRLMQALKFA